LKSLFCRIIFLMGALAVLASADSLTSYTISFTGSAPIPTAGSFTWDSTVQEFAAFNVTWNGLVFYLAGDQQDEDETNGCGMPDTQNSIFLLLTTPGGFCGSGQAGPEWMADAESNGDSLGFYDTNATDTSTIFVASAEVIGGQPVGNPQGVFSGGFSTAIVAASAPELSSLLLTLAGSAVLVAGKRQKL
jgi:hypothetical protein